VEGASPLTRRLLIGHLWWRWRALFWPDRLLLGEAVILIFLSTVVTRVVTFRQLGRVAARPRCRNVAAPERRRLVGQRVRWAVLVSARWVPWTAKCFQQGLAAQWMLRRRGVASTLFYGGAMLPGKGLETHVWVQDGEIPIIGGEIADRYRILATFPASAATVKLST
jgi:hypothetical protein